MDHLKALNETEKDDFIEQTLEKYAEFNFYAKGKINRKITCPKMND